MRSTKPRARMIRLRQNASLAAAAIAALASLQNARAGAPPSAAITPDFSKSDLDLEVNIITGDVYLEATTAVAFTGYTISDPSAHLLGGSASPDPAELLSVSASNGGNVNSYEAAGNYVNWHNISETNTELAEGQGNNGFASHSSRDDTINIPARGVIDFGAIYNTTANNQDISFDFTEAGSTPTNGPAYYGAEVDYFGGSSLEPDIYWKNNVLTGNWSSGSNWATSLHAGGPVSTDNVYITTTGVGSRSVTLDVTASINSLTIGGTGGGSDTLYQTGPYNISAPDGEEIGFGGGCIGAHIQSAGGTNLGVSELSIGWGPGAAGTYSLSGTGTFNAGILDIGEEAANGTFSQCGGSATFTELWISTGAGNGSCLLSGGTLSFNSGSNANAGYIGGFFSGEGNQPVTGGNATLAISGGAMTITGNVILFSTSTVNQSGGTFTASGFDQLGGTASFTNLNVGTVASAAGGNIGFYTLSGGTLNIAGGTFNTGSAFVVGNGSAAARLNLIGGSTARYVFAQGLNVSSAATLTGGGTLTNSASNTPVTVAGTIAPTAAQNSLSINGSLTLQSTATTLVQRIGSTPSFGTVQTTGNLVLSGVLAVYQDAANEAITNPTQSFIVLSTTGGTLSGTFSNIASGQTLYTTDGTESCVVTIDPGTDGYVELGDFQPAPEPGAVGMVGVAAGPMLLRRRRVRKF